MKFNPHVQEFKPTTNEQINVSVFVPSNINSSNPLNLPINNPNQVVNDEKKLEIQNKMKKSLRLNPNSKEFHQNPTPNEVKAPSVLEEDKNDTSLGKWDMPIPKVEEKKEPPKMVKKIPIPKKEEPKEQKKPEENNEKPKIQSEIIKSSEGLEQIKEVKEEDTEKPEKLEKKSEEKEIKIEEIVTPAIIEEEKLEIIPEKVVIIQENEIPKETIKHTQPIIKKNYIVELIKVKKIIKKNYIN